MRDRNQLRRPACCNVQGERGSERRRPRSLRGSGAPLATHDVLFGWRNRVKDFLALKVADGRWIVLSLVSRAAPRNLWLARRENAPTLCWLATKRLYRRETAYTLSEASARDWNLVRGECRWALILVFGRSKNWVFFSPSVTRPGWLRRTRGMCWRGGAMSWRRWCEKIWDNDWQQTGKCEFTHWPLREVHELMCRINQPFFFSTWSSPRNLRNSSIRKVHTTETRYFCLRCTIVLTLL